MDISIAVLGLPSSGKTALIESFDQNKNMFEPLMTFEPQMVFETPTGFGEMSVFHQRKYRLSIQSVDQHSLSITEFPGDLLEKRDASAEAKGNMKLSLLTQTAWVIMIDGAWFQSNQEDEIEKIIRKKYARIVVPLVSAYADAHDGQAPDIMFVASKSGQYLLPYLNEEGKAKFDHIVESAFGGLVSETTKPLILLSDTSIKTAVVAILALSFLHYRGEVAKQSRALSMEIQSIAARQNQLAQKLNIENGKMLKSRSVIRDLEQQLAELSEEKQNKTSQLRAPASDNTMRNLGISLQMLMQRNQAMLAGGFENLGYAYDKSVEEGCFENFWRKKTTIPNIFVVMTMFIVLTVLTWRNPALDHEVLSGGIVVSVFWGVIAFAFKNSIAKVIGTLGVFGGFMICFGESIALACLFLYVVWLFVNHSIMKFFDNIRAKRLNIPNVRYKDELVRFYDEAVRKG